jgi:hypothetical protein
MVSGMATTQIYEVTDMPLALGAAQSMSGPGALISARMNCIFT